MRRAFAVILALVAVSAVHAADAPDAVYRMFHGAIMAKNYAEAAKQASAFTSIVVRGGEVDKMPLKSLVPKSAQPLRSVRDGTRRSLAATTRRPASIRREENP
jgi:hypothetical protein